MRFTTLSNYYLIDWWCNFNFCLFACWIDFRFCYSYMTWETGGLELASTIILVLQANRLTKCASHTKLESDKGYKYLGILEADDIMHTEIKDKIQKEYYRRVRTLTSSKLNGGNTVRAINSRAVSLVRYSTAIQKWTKDELKVMNRKTRKIMTMNRMYNPQNDTDRLYIPRMEGGRWLQTV